MTLHLRRQGKGREEEGEGGRGGGRWKEGGTMEGSGGRRRMRERLFLSCFANDKPVFAKSGRFHCKSISSSEFPTEF